VSLRLPKAPRSVTYYAPNADVIAVGSSSDVYRMSLETGRFLAPLPSGSPGLNVARVCPAHGLLAAGGEDGALECFDLRMPQAPTRLDNASGPKGGGVTCLRFDDSGMTVRSARDTPTLTGRRAC
jgi:ribosome biogenesis protein ENP2